jgi:hypothetical protein
LVSSLLIDPVQVLIAADFEDLAELGVALSKDSVRTGHVLVEVLGVENPLKNMAEVFERAVDISLDKKDPKRKRERRFEREREQRATQGKSRPDEIVKPDGDTAGEEEKAKSRYISSEVRERVYGAEFIRAKIDAKKRQKASRGNAAVGRSAGPFHRGVAGAPRE